MGLPVYNLEEYSGQVMNKNKINMMSRNETKAKYGICRRLDNKLKIYIKKVARKHQSQEDLIQNFCVNKFGVLSLCYLCCHFFTRIYLYSVWSILHKNKRATCETAIYVFS